ncbi:uncharacterized protein LOC142166351 [Nicotiana tabacum]|uniref:Uncharacterized protein LOC142166351 n=1 Tax=Nicotiana tabacum TaxID=4097 RepID=A0AC58S966_TOBAC
MARTMLIESGVPKSFWAEAVNTAYFLINKCMLRSLLDKTPYELLNERKPKLIYLRAFGCKCFVLNNGKEALENFDTKSDEGIFLGYSSQNKLKHTKSTTKGLNVEESVHVIFYESHHLSGKDSHDKDNQDGEFSKVHGEVIDMANGKVDLKSQIKETSEEDAVELPADLEEPGPSITATEADDRVVDTILGTHELEQRSGIHTFIDGNDGSHIEELDPSHPETQSRSKARNMFAFSAFLSQIEPNNIKEALKDTDWIAAMQ